MQMKKPLLILLPALFLLLAGGLPANPQEEKGNREIQEEYVEVINAEVIVRALKKEQLVGGLQKSDFTLYENGKKQEITSFQEVKRKIGAEKAETAESPDAAAPGARIFLFYFWVSEPEPQLKETLDFFFKRVYREGDYVLLVTGNRVFKITRPDQVPQALSEVKSKLDEVTGYARMDRAAFVNSMENLLGNLEEQLPRVNDGAAPGAQTGSAAGRNVLEQFAANYKRLWDEYKTKRINLNVDKLKAIAESLKGLEFEKWGLVFFQPDLVPQLDTDRFIREKQDALADYTELQKTFAAISREIDKPAGSLAILEEIRRAFLDANATFHLLLSNMAPPDRLNSRFLKLDHVYSDWQEVFRNISRSTGGAVIEGNKPDKSLARAMEKVDIYYRLTYQPPKEGQRTRDIEVKTALKRINLVYNREMILKETDNIAIDRFSFTPAPANATLEFTLKNYRQLYDGYQVYGNIRVKVSAVDEQGEIISFERVFEPEDAAIVPSLKLNFPHGGKYTLIVEALDRQTGKSAAFSRKIETVLDNREEGEPVLMIPAHEKTGAVDKKNNLDALLEKTADYCEKLKQATFYFTCREEISDIYFIKGKEIKNDFYRHEYQIIMDEKGRMSEERKEIAKDGKGKGDDGLVLTNFFSNYPFLMPGALMDRENRKKYLYRLLAKEKVGEVETFKINVEPKNPANPAGGIINHGVVWVDEQDGSVVKIELDPRSLRGIDVLQETARKKGAGLKVVDIHWYEVQSNNIRFPSRTEISEVKLAAQEELENSRTVFTYKDYRFFKVNVNVVDSGNE
ncbi:MAG: hypothetical protein NT166_18070 [Candidatus Aminicenantes bacterium]|nr:hypothetical protein [Candidatus Aminicenantes bacterium]